jgi:DNA ligase (NAD+)
MDIEERIIILSKFLAKCDERYFLYNESPLGDADYDLLSQELENLKKKLNKPIDKPLFKNLTKESTKYAHDFPMLSLQKIYELKEIDDFFEKSQNKNNDGIIMELKIDGVSVSLIYKGGILFQGLTRGDGVMGEDITHNIFCIKEIPLIIKDDELKNKTVIIRGELYISKTNHQLHFNDQNHPRNSCAGLIRRKYLDDEGQYIHFFGYGILNSPIKTQGEVLNQLKTWGFPIENHFKIINDLTDLHGEIHHWREKISEMDYECDGIVLKINNIKDFHAMGNTISHPRGAVAFKFANKKKTTFLKEIQWQVGKNGRVIPVGIINPIVIDGITIQKVTLHNYDFVNNLKNTTVIVERAGGVIPKVIVFDKEIPGDDVKSIIKIPSHCPSCTHLLLKTEKDLLCPNYQCPKQKLERMIHFCDTLKLYGIGEKTMEKLINDGIVKGYKDILTIPQYKNGLENISIVIWTKFIDQVEKLPKDFNLLKGITMDYGGKKNLEKIIELLKNNRNFIDGSYEEVYNYLIIQGNFTPGIGGLMAKSLIQIKGDLKDLMDILK